MSESKHSFNKENPLVTIVVPSFNQGHYLHKALDSIFSQNFPVEVFVMDGGSTDDSIGVIAGWGDNIKSWRSYPDSGQAAAINEGIALGSAPYVCWLNSDDWYLPGSLELLVNALEGNPSVAAVYAASFDYIDAQDKFKTTWVEPFSVDRLALRCIVSQPATMIRRAVWHKLGGLDVTLLMAMDFDLWWRIYKLFGSLLFINKMVAVNRVHGDTKTNTNRKLHYREAMKVVKKYYGHVPIKWWLMQPYSIWLRTIMHLLRGRYH